MSDGLFFLTATGLRPKWRGAYWLWTPEVAQDFAQMWQANNGFLGVPFSLLLQVFVDFRFAVFKKRRGEQSMKSGHVWINIATDFGSKIPLDL